MLTQIRQFTPETLFHFSKITIIFVKRFFNVAKLLSLLESGKSINMCCYE